MNEKEEKKNGVKFVSDLFNDKSEVGKYISGVLKTSLVGDMADKLREEISLCGLKKLLTKISKEITSLWENKDNEISIEVNYKVGGYWRTFYIGLETSEDILSRGRKNEDTE